MTVLAQALQVLAFQFPNATVKPEEALDALQGPVCRHDPLALDKWYAIQAMAPGGDRPVTGSPNCSTALTSTVRNPNRMRSLIGAFSAGNPTGFNRGRRRRLPACLQREVVRDRQAQSATGGKIANRDAVLAVAGERAGRNWHARLALVSIRESGDLSSGCQ
jgi:aminopeptidase N